MGKLYFVRVTALALILSFTTACCSISDHCGGTVSKPDEISYTVNRHVKGIMAATVAIKTTDKAPRIIGSGVVLRYRKGQKLLVLTAKHVSDHLEDKENIAFCLRDCTTLIPAHTNKNSKADLSLLESDKPMKEDGPEAILASEEPSLGDTVYVAGSPSGLEFNISKGILSSIEKTEETILYRIDAAVYYGNSGGGLWDDSGHLIGIVVQLSVGPAGIIPGSGQAVSLSEVKQFLYSFPLRQ